MQSLQAATRNNQLFRLQLGRQVQQRESGPGPNYFSNSANNVFVDTSGRLHLKITTQANHWYCAEVVLQASPGHGTYRWYLDTPVDALDPNVVLGLFTWSDLPDYANREIDIEFSRWGMVKNLNAQYVVQPFDLANHLYRFNEPAGLPQSTHSFRWGAGNVAFNQREGIPVRHPTSRHYHPAMDLYRHRRSRPGR